MTRSWIVTGDVFWPVMVMVQVWADLGWMDLKNTQSTVCYYM
ncbi:MAG: hypothetical protein ABR887_04575 [Methanoregulaceae archaeon]